MTTDVRPTLRALSGAPAEPIALRDSTLILIDCQQIVAASVLQNASLAALADCVRRGRAERRGCALTG